MRNICFVLASLLLIGTTQYGCSKEKSNSATDRVYQEGVAFLEAGYHDDAIDSFNRAIKENPNRKEALSKLND